MWGGSGAPGVNGGVGRGKGAGPKGRTALEGQVPRKRVLDGDLCGGRLTGLLLGSVSGREGQPWGPDRELVSQPGLSEAQGWAFTDPHSALMGVGCPWKGSGLGVQRG